MKQLYLSFIFILGLCSANAQWNSSTTVNLEAAGLQSGDVICGATSTGGTFIAFYSQNGGNFDMRVQLLDAQGFKQFGPNGMVINNLPTGSATFVFNAIVDNFDNFIVAYNDQRAGPNGTVINKVTPDGTLPWGINGIYLGPGLSPYPAVLTNGEVAVAWGNSNSPNTISIQKITTGGTVAWSPAKIVPSINTLPVTRPQLVSLTANKFSLIYQQRISSPSGSNLYALQFDVNGDSTWPRVKIANSFTSTFNYYSVISDNDATYVGYYCNPTAAPSRFYSYLQKINGDGSLPWLINGTEFASDHIYDQLVTHIAKQPGSNEVWALSNCTTASQSPYGIYAQKYSATFGTRLLSDNAKAVFVPDANREQHAGNISVLNGTDLMFMYNDVNNKLHGTRLDGTGSFVWAGNTIELGSTTTSKLRYNFMPIVNGQAVAIWSENRGIENRPYAQNITSNGNTGPLPVTLLDFTGSLFNNSVILSWKTLTESNNHGFSLQQSVDGSSFTDITFVLSKALNGNSTSELNYQYIDQSPYKGASFYRLKQIDKDGRFVYSQVVSIMRKSSLFLQKLYPTPAINSLYLTFNSPQAENVSVRIADVMGRIIQKGQLNLNMGVGDYKVDVSSLSEGMYFIEVSDNGGNMFVEKFVKGE